MKTEIYKHIEVLVNRYPVLNSVKDEIVEAYFLLVESYKNEGKLLIAGNGGSAADAEHIVGELMKGFKLPRKLNENFTDKLISENEELGTVLAESLQGALAAIICCILFVLVIIIQIIVFKKEFMRLKKIGDVL